MHRLLITTFVVSLGLASIATSQVTETPSAKESDPTAMGWMQGSPPPDDRTIRFTDADFFAFPKLRWTVCNFRELMPTAGVDKGPQAARKLRIDLDPAIDAVKFTPLGATEPMTWNAAFDANYSDGLLVLHRGRIVYERYAGCLDETNLHGVMSVTKSITGLVAEVLVTNGTLNEKEKVGDLIPELADSAFGDASVRQVMNMTTGLDYSEDYSDPDADVWKYGLAGSPLPPPADYEGPRSYFGFLETVKKAGKHGNTFGYRTINADVLGWIIARSTGKTVAEWLASNVWSRIGAEREAFYTVDSIGTPFAGGGFNATLRDLGRFGQLILNEGRLGSEQLLPVASIKHIRDGGDKEAFTKAGYDTLKGWSYRSMWWVSHDDHGAFAARGVHGQTIWIDPKARMVIVRLASHPVAGNAANDPTSLPAYRAVANYLMTQESKPQLSGREWVIEEIAGHGVTDRSNASLVFLADGALAGNSSCNRIVGSYKNKGGQLLQLDMVGTTRMACPEALMNQERSLLQLLPNVKSFDFDKTGALILTTTDDQTITARRQ